MTKKKIIEVLKANRDEASAFLKTMNKDNEDKDRLTGMIQGYEFAIKLLEGQS